MKLESQKTTSKGTLLNLMILKAWRERWTDFQWGINIKKILPRGVSGDAYNLADCILQQAVVGGANQLILSYLRHSLCSHLISYAAVLKWISKYEGYDKKHCTKALLEFLDSIIPGITCRNKQEECVIVDAISNLVIWLMNIYISNQTQHEPLVINKLNSIMEKMCGNQFTMGILYLGKVENKLIQLEDIRKRLDPAHPFKNQQLEERFDRVINISLSQMDVQADIRSDETITYALQPIIAVELLRPSSDMHNIIKELLMIKNLKHLPQSRFYCEILRACLISLIDVNGTSRESLWCAFTFIKLPQLLIQLISILHSDNDTDSEYNSDLIDALELLLEESPLLDIMDFKCSFNVIEILLGEMLKHSLVSEQHVKHFSAKRETVSSCLQNLEIHNQPTAIVKYVIRAESPLAGILKTLNTDYNKVQEALLSFMCQLLTGNSLDLILAVATVEGKLKLFVNRLIKCNECSKQVPGEVGKAAVTRSVLFDVSFLILTFIVQTFGSDVVLEENGDSFFEKWVRNCMEERNKWKSPMSIVRSCDQSKVDELLLFINSPPKNPQIATNLKWHEICETIPSILHHVLLAWENGLSPSDVSNILENLKNRLCAYSVCAASWLCSYMKVINEDEHIKPMTMIQQLMTPCTNEELHENFSERFGLSFQIIRKMQLDFQNQSAGARNRSAVLNRQNLVSQNPLEEQFQEAWDVVKETGWLPNEAAQTLENLLQSCGPTWFIQKLVMEIFSYKYITEMNKTIDVVFSVMHLNIEAMTVALINELPVLMINKANNGDIVQPQSTVLARLCVYALLSAIQLQPVESPKKRSREMDDNIDTSPALKMRKLNPELTDDAVFGVDFKEIGGTEKSVTEVIREPLLGAIKQMFKLFLQYIVADEYSPKAYFVFELLTLLVQCGGEKATPILKLVPSGFVQNLMKITPPSTMTAGTILKLYDLTVQNTRQNALSDLCLLRNIQIRNESIRL